MYGVRQALPNPTATIETVVTDVGGPLSHGSIVAHEHGTSAVMGTGVARPRAASGMAYGDG
ncbi:MAG: PEP-utilizing enzyme [Anaerolineae bacterium]|jgi:pyruvate,water dikinase|nr:PEP-utilizing enzyme [Anaerolineae bacterium]